MNKKLTRARNLLKKHKLDVLVVADPVNLFYFTGKHFSQGMLLLTENSAYLAVDGRYFEKAKTEGFTLLHLEESPLEHVFEKEPSCKAIGFDDMTMTSYQERLFKKSASSLKGKKRAVSFKRLSSLLQTLRSIKEEEEIAFLQEAAALGVKGYEHLLSLLQEGVTETFLEQSLRIFWLENGGEDVSFSPIIAFGENSAIPHHNTSNRKLKKGDIVLLDIGVKKQNYCSDMTRTVFFGPPNQKLKEIYLLVQEAQKRALDKCCVGASFSEIDRAARTFLEEKGYGKQFCHSLGHGVGIEIHEAPSLAPYTKKSTGKLQPGHVVTIEPGLYLPGVGGVRIEDTVVIQESGLLNLTCASKDLVVIG